MLSGIYCIENIVNNKKYIGQSRNLEKRMKEHFYYLKNNIRDNAHLKNAYNKYGKENFIFYILLYCESFELTRYEQFFVDFYTPEKLYNIRLDCVESNLGVGGKNHPMYGKHHSEKSKEKMSKSHMGKNNHLFGKHLSDEHKRKISENHADVSGKNNPMFGKHHSKKISFITETSSQI